MAIPVAIPMAPGFSPTSQLPAIPMALSMAIPMAPVVFPLLSVTCYPYGAIPMAPGVFLLLSVTSYSYGYSYGSWGVPPPCNYQLFL